MSEVLCEVADGVMTITLNRPDKLNAYTATMGRDLAAMFNRADRDDDVRVVIVTGAGRAFCAGADISAGARAFDTSEDGAGSVSFGDRRAETPNESFVWAIYNCRKPSIAAFNGAAAGVGVTMTLPMDIRIAANTAKFGLVFARRGMVPEAGSTWFLPRIVGLPQALRWCLTGFLFDAEEARAGGLISETVEPDALMSRASAIAREIADNTSAVSVALTRQMLWRLAEEQGPAPVLALDTALAMALGKSPDVREGVSAFLEKRKPFFTASAWRDLPAETPWWPATE